MRRRDFIKVIAASAVAGPVAVRAQQPGLPVIGYLGNESPNLSARRLNAFRRGFGSLGYVEGKNVAIEYRWAEGRPELLPELVAVLVRRRVSVIATMGSPSARAAKAATATVPVVFQGGFDPVEMGLVKSLARPGGNITGVSTLNVELGPKRLELLHELIPKVIVIALLVNPSHPLAERQTRDLQAAARGFGLQVHILHARNDRDFDAAFASAAKLRAGGLVIANMNPFVFRSKQLGALAARHGLPAIFGYEFAAAGGLAGYSGSNVEASHLAGVYTGRILKGEKPADLPVYRLTKFEMTINLKAAKALGINVPLPLLGRADEVIE